MKVGYVRQAFRNLNYSKSNVDRVNTTRRYVGRVDMIRYRLYYRVKIRNLRLSPISVNSSFKDKDYELDCGIYVCFTLFIGMRHTVVLGF